MKKLLLISWLTFTVCQSLWATTLAWNVNPEPDIAGYKIYIGHSSRKYTQNFDVGNQTTYVTEPVIPGRPYYFAVTAYNTAGLESEHSAEVSYTPPMPPTSVDFKPWGLLTAQVFPGGVFQIEASTDFQTWASIREFRASTSEFTMQIPASLDFRFFRLKWLHSLPPEIAAMVFPKPQAPLSAFTAAPPMPPFPPTDVKLTKWQKLQLMLRYRPGKSPVYEKGGEKLNRSAR